MQGGAALASVKAHESRVFCLGIAPQRGLLLSAGKDGTLKAWRLAALEDKNPGPLWVFDKNGAMTSAINCLTVLEAEGAAFVGTLNDGFFAINLADGVPRWSQFTHTTEVTADPASARVFAARCAEFGGNGTVRCHASSGALLWTRRVQLGDASAAMAHQRAMGIAFCGVQNVLFTASDKNGKIMSFDARDVSVPGSQSLLLHAVCHRSLHARVRDWGACRGRLRGTRSPSGSPCYRYELEAASCLL